MWRLRIDQNKPYEVVVKDGTGTSRTMRLAPTGDLGVPGALSFNNHGGNPAVFDPSLLTAQRTYTWQNRNGTVALLDQQSLSDMLPTQTGNAGKALFTNGTTPEWGSFVANINLTATDPSATYVGAALTISYPMAATAGCNGGLVTNLQYQNLAKLDAAAGAQTFANAPLITTTSSNPNAAATVGQLQASQAGLSVRPPVRLADTTNTTQPAINPVIDGVTVAIGDRVLFTNLAAGPTNNRVYRAAGVLGAVTWTLCTDGQAGDGAPTDGDLLYVQEGDTQADYQYAYNGAAWVVYSRQSTYNFGLGLLRSGINVTVDFAPDGTSSATQAVRADDSRLSNDRNPIVHDLVGARHAISGETPGSVLLATTASTYDLVPLTGDVAVSGAGAALVNNIQGVPVSSLANTIIAMAADPATQVAIWAQPAIGVSAVHVNYTARSGTLWESGKLVIVYRGSGTPEITRMEEISDDTGLEFAVQVNAGNLQLVAINNGIATAYIRFTTLVFGTI